MLSSTTPREGLKIVTERFSNRNGKAGGNVFKDRRVEFRIRILKLLLSNLGPHMNSENIMKINKVIDIKEKLFHHARISHGVSINSGAHKKRSDEADYKLLFDNLCQTQAHMEVVGRKFGEIKYPENLLDADLFNKAAFYRWLAQKNRDFAAAQAGTGAAFALPGAYLLKDTTEQNSYGSLESGLESSDEG